jgi:ankyrin repeat protein
VQTETTKKSPLMLASGRGYLATVKLLVERGADLYATDVSSSLLLILISFILFFYFIFLFLI